MNCPQCGNLIGTRDSFCSECGQNFASQIKIVKPEPYPTADSIRRQKHNRKVLVTWFFSTIIIFSIMYLLKYGL